MAELLIEIHSEEIPARMQKGAMEQASTLFQKILKESGLDFDVVLSWVSCQRLNLILRDLTPQTQEGIEKKRGPKVSAPPQALEGFLRANNLNQSDLKEDQGYWYAEIQISSQKTEALLPSLIDQFLKSFSWPKSMRWHNFHTGQVTASWIRPIRSLLCLYDGKPLSFFLPDFNVQTTDSVQGHRFLRPESFQIKDAKDYQEKLRQAFVLVDPIERKQVIEKELFQKATDLHLELVKDEALLEEICGLVDYPFVQIGLIDELFMVLPPEVLSTSMRVHQKYFSLRDPKTGKLAPYFSVVGNVPGSPSILKGFEKVLVARLTDALFFYEEDQKKKLEEWANETQTLIFHEKLGSFFQKTERLMSLMSSPEGKRAASLCKGDLQTSLVKEFPELQGIMGEIYANLQGEDLSVSKSLSDYYHPQGAHDPCPESPLGCELALMDRIDTLVGLWGIGLRPTGSKDPYALRRQALGIIRLLVETPLENKDLFAQLEKAVKLYEGQGTTLKENTAEEILEFINERLAVWVQQKGYSPQLIEAFFSAKTYHNLKEAVHNLEIFSEWIGSAQGQEVLRIYRRVWGFLQGASLEKNICLEKSYKEVLEQISLKQNASCSFEDNLLALLQISQTMDLFLNKETILVEDMNKRNQKLLLLKNYQDTLQCFAKLDSLFSLL